MQGWKTFTINTLVALAGLAATVVQDAPISEDPKALALTIIGGINVVLRFLTTTPIFQSSEE